MRFAAKRSSSGWTVRSFLPIMYQLGFDLQAVPSTPPQPLLNPMVEDVRSWREVRGPDDLLLLFR